ncbi:MAG: hypothetical protein ACRYGO_07515 [Janthinobacterium lividum]
MFYYYVTKGAIRKEIPLGPDLALALTEYAKLTERESPKRRLPAPQGVERLLFKSIRKNALPRGIPVEITEADVQTMLARANGRCELSGIPFDSRPDPGYRIRPWMPSVDRVDSRKPYTIENCRIVCSAVNIALNQFGEAVLLQIASGIIGARRRRAMRTFAVHTANAPENQLAESEKSQLNQASAHSSVG